MYNVGEKALGVFKWIYIIRGIFICLLGILFLALQNNDALVKASDSVVNTSSIQLPDGVSLVVFMGAVLIISSIFNFIEAWLFSRAKKDAKKTTLLMVLLVLGSITGIYNLITAFSVSNITSVVMSLIALYAVYVVRKEA